LSAKHTDQEILTALSSRRGKDKGFRMLLAAYSQRLYWHIRKIVGVHEDADDVVQNMWVKVYKNIEGFEGNSGLYTWLYRIATNEALTLIRKRKKLAGSDESYLEDWSDRLQSDPYFDGEEAALILERIVMQLPEKQKQVFLLRYYENMNYADISKVTNVSVGGLKAQFHHARNKIQKALENEY
jgi:RNA polymerase sigma-70 factor (ECF subfamily)